MIKKYLNTSTYIIATLLVLWLLSSLFVMSKQRAEISRLGANLDQYGRKVSELTLTTKELNGELEKKSEAVVELDSLLRLRNKTIKQLKEYNRTVITIRDTVSVEVPIIVEKIDTAKYNVKFKDSTECISVKGHIITSDSLPSVTIDEKECNVKIWDIRTKRRWWQFWKPKYEHEIISECGEVETIIINKK